MQNQKIEEFLEDMRMEGKAEGTLREYKRRLERVQKLGIDLEKKTGIPFHCHLLRHTFAALLTEKGVPLTTVQYLLGHKSLGMTAHYAQSALVDLSDLTPKIEL